MKKRNNKKQPATARELAVQALLQINQGGAYSNLLLQNLFKGQKEIDPRDRALITELVYGVLQHKRLVDFYWQPFVQKGIESLEPWIRELLRVSVYQAVFLEKIPPHAIVNEAVEIAKRLGHQGISKLVNGVLRNFFRQPLAKIEQIVDPVERLAIHTSHPTWLVERWVSQFGLETTQAICQANNLPSQVSLRVNLLKISRQELQEELGKLGYSLRESEVVEAGLILERSHPGLTMLLESKWYLDGYFTFQDESSMLVAPFLDPQPGMRVLDACAAPGGKTTHLAEYMRNEGSILALDLHEHKVRLIEQTARRMQHTIIETMAVDARHLSLEDQETAIKVAPFDKILLDAPCSGLGVIKRKPDLKWKKEEKDIEQLQKIQYELLSRMSKLLKIGGQLVYSTCTLEYTENQGQIERFLSENPHFKLAEAGMKQIFPQDFGSDGFFMSKLEKVGEPNEASTV